MAVRINMDAVRQAVEPSTFHAAEELRAAGRLGRIVMAGGGAVCAVRAGGTDDRSYEVWVGVVDREFIGECDCPASIAEPDELCVHAVALTLAALDENFAWSPSAIPPSASEIDPRLRDFAELAAGLPVRGLARLVAEHALTDRRLEMALLTYAGRLGPLTDDELVELRQSMDRLTSEVTNGRWDPHDVLKAGQWIVEELEVLVQRPPSAGALSAVEYAAGCWDGLVGGLPEPAEGYVDDLHDVGAAVRAVHVRLCVELRPDPDELVDRLLDLIEAAEEGSCLDQPEDYLAVLGPDRVAAVRDGQRSGTP